MNTNILREEIQWLLETINEQYDVIRKYDDKIPQIEFDILLENVRKLYEKLHLVNRTNDPYAFFEQHAHEPIHIRPLDRPEPFVSQDQPEEPAVREKPSVTIVYDDGNDTDDSKETPSGGDDLEELDLFSAGITGFSDKLQEARHRSLGPGPRKHKQSDLKGLITINEKFLFINELFDGNLREYNNHIDALNRFSDLKSALDYLDLLRKKSLWNSESTAFSRMKELVEMRYG